jgi:signal transduction histidine kinase
MDREGLLAAAKALEVDYDDLRVSYELALEHNTSLENELYAHNADLKRDFQATEAQLMATRAEMERVHQHLVMRERLAKLGELVAGMTHELNTPLGVAVTAASFERTSIDRLRDLLASCGEGGCGSAEHMAAELASLEEADVLIQSNLARAAETVGSFKQMAVDQSSDRQREFLLGDIIRQTVASLKPQLRGTEYTVEVDCPQSVPMRSYPGTIRISVEWPPVGGDPGVVLIRHADNGHGIQGDVLPHIFEEYFTTAAETGGSGLGLSIVRSLVSKRLGGTIGCISFPAAGDGDGRTIFELRLPRHVTD